MKKNIFFITFLIVTFNMLGQSQPDMADVKIGDTFKIGKPASTGYLYIKFPKPNMIIKRGGVADYKRIIGNIVVVTSVHQKKDGTRIVKVKRKNGKRFFGSHPIVSIHLKQALSSGELIL